MKIPSGSLEIMKFTRIPTETDSNSGVDSRHKLPRNPRNHEIPTKKHPIFAIYKKNGSSPSLAPCTLEGESPEIDDFSLSTRRISNFFSEYPKRGLLVVF